MKIKKGFSLRTIGKEHIIIGGGNENIDFSRIINLNESAARLWKEIENKEFTASDLSALLTEWYEVDKETADNDAQLLINEWLKADIIEQ